MKSGDRTAAVELEEGLLTHMRKFLIELGSLGAPRKAALNILHRVLSCLRSANTPINPVNGIAGAVSVP